MDNAAYILTTNSLILEKILGYLPIVDLIRLQNVCKPWMASSTRIIRMREKEQQSELITVTQESQDKKFVTFKRTGKEMVWDKQSQAYKHLREWKKNWTSLPKTGICICHVEPSQKKFNFETDNLMRFWLPPSSKLLVLGSISSVVCVDIGQAEKENNVGNGKAFYNFLSFPSKPNAFSVDFLHLRMDHVEREHDDFVTSVQQEMDDPNTKLLFICERHFPNQFLPLMHDSFLVPAVKKGIVVTGCMFDSPIVLSPDGSSVSHDLKNDSQHSLVVMSFKGKNVRASSVLISADIDTLSGLLEEVKKLQDTVLDFSKDCPTNCRNRSLSGYCNSCCSQTIGIMIACCYRANSCEWYNCEETAVTRNLEQKTFRQMIPNVPLLGAFGMGEIGESINLVSPHCASNASGDIEDLHFGESTVFAVVMLK